MDKQLTSRKEVAKHFGVCDVTVKRWEKQKKLKAEVVINGRPKYILADVIAAVTKKQTQ